MMNDDGRIDVPKGGERRKALVLIIFLVGKWNEDG
jgi:hypothetical protein